MKRLVCALAISALAATPSLALDAKIKKDAKTIAADGAQSKKDQSAAAELLKQAALLESQSAGELKRASELWHEWSKLNSSAANKRAQARSNRYAASKLNAAAGRLLQAEQLRSDALHDRQVADALHKSAWAHLLKASTAQSAVSEAQKALGDLKSNPAFADAIKVIQADMAKNQAIIGPEQAVAKVENDAAAKLVAEAPKKEQQADLLAKALMPPPPKPVAPPPPPKAIVVSTPPVKVSTVTASAGGAAAGGFNFIQLDGTELVLDIDQRRGKTTKGNSVMLYKKKATNNKNQLWALTTDGLIKSADGNVVLDIDQRTAGGKAGASIIVWEPKASNNVNQKWVVAGGVIQSQAGDLVLDVDQRKGKTGESSPVIVWTKKAGDNGNQRFKLVPQ